MAGVNKVILVGHLGRDPEVRTLNEGTKVASFSLATTESYKDRTTGERKDQTEWHNIVLWRGLAEIAERYLNKGSQIYVEGKIRTRQYEQDGVTKYRTEIVADQMTMLGSRGDGANAGQSASSYAPPAAQSSPASNDMEMSNSGGATDDLPF